MISVTEEINAGILEGLKKGDPLVTLATIVWVYKGFCPVCQRDDSLRPHPKLIFLKGECPACIRPYPPRRRPMMRPEDAPERLIEIIQSGSIIKEKREEAMLALIDRCKYFIRKVIHSIFYSYKLGPIYNMELADFFQTGLVEFMDLVINDFKIKDHPTDTGLAYFGTYIRVKFYRRLQSRVQTELKHQNYAMTRSVDLETEVMAGWNDGRFDKELPYDKEIAEALVANSFQIEEEVLENMTQDRVKHTLTQVFEISHDLVNQKKIEGRDRDIWQAYYVSGKMIAEIGEDFEVSRSRVLQVSRNVNDRITMEFGRRAAILHSGIDVYPSKSR